ncbi:MAG: efflux RND transporter periplasmic adaptor subunit [Bacteroidetes bacterium]|nr:efflux RND transporter periplasmic adaptor subunit [Bacteroidota bacterium]
MNQPALIQKGVIGLFFVALLFFSSCNKSNVTTTPVVQDITESIYASGVIKAVGQYEVFATSGGIIKEILVKEGDTINPETPLFVIDNMISAMSTENARLNMELSKDKTGPASNTLRELESRVQLAKAKMKNDSILLERQKNLWAQQVGSKVDLERRELSFQAAVTDFEGIQLQYNQAKLELLKSYQQSVNNLKISQKQQADYTIRSSIYGTIYSILKEKGELVSLQTPIAIIGESNQFEIEMQVDEYDITKVKMQQRVFITMDSYRGEVFEAAVVRIEPYMNQRTRTFKVLAKFKEKPTLLFPNLTIEANILTEKKENALTIPAAYLIGNNQLLTGPSDTILVAVGIANMQWVEITSGLDVNQKIFLPVK